MIQYICVHMYRTNKASKQAHFVKSIKDDGGTCVHRKNVIGENPL